MSDEPVMLVPRLDAFLNRWSATYDAARASREAEGGVLLTFGSQSLVAHDASDWGRIGHDCARPRDLIAWRRLRARREIAG